MPINTLTAPPIYNLNGQKQKIGNSAANSTNPTLSTSFTADEVLENTTAVENFDNQIVSPNQYFGREMIGSSLFAYSTKIKNLYDKVNEIIATTNQNEANIITLAEKRKATPTEYFNKNADYFATPELISNDVRLARFSVSNSATGLTQAVAVGGSYNILTPLLEASETQASNIPIIYKTIANATQSKLLNQTTDVIILPSPLYTYNNTYNRYNVLASCVADIPTIQNNSVIELYIVIRRASDNVEIIRSRPFLYTATNSGGGDRLNAVLTASSMPLIVSGEADALCNGGFKIFLESASYSIASITLKSINLTIFRD